MTKDIKIGHRVRQDGEWRVEVESYEDAPAFPGAEKSAHHNLIMIPISQVPEFMNAVKYVKPFAWLFEHDKYTLAIDRTVVYFAEVLLDIYQKSHPLAVPQFDDDVVNCTLARLHVFIWWLKYAHKKYGRSARLEIS